MKRFIYLAMALCMGISLVACGNTESTTESDELPFSIDEEPITVKEPEEESVEEDPDYVPENSYRSELTNEWISNDIKDQRPIAVMVDNEITALPHYGLNSADIVYEMVNSTANDRVTRLMAIVKDWQNIEQLGSIRSTRTTNLLISPEYNAIVVHDGGPFYINDYLADPWVDHLSGGFARFSNGKATEFTEYVTSESYTNTSKGKTYAGIIERIDAANIETDYNEYYPGQHFSFNDEDTELDSSDKAETIHLNFPHNESSLYYNEDTKLYEYYEYESRDASSYKEGQVGAHIDPLDDNNVLAFKNVIIYAAELYQLDENGYMVYNVINSGNKGYYITDGKAVPISWSKKTNQAITEFKNLDTGEDIVLNTGKTYIAIVPTDTWNDLVVE